MKNYSGSEPGPREPGLRSYSAGDLSDSQRIIYARCSGCGKTYVNPEDLRSGFDPSMKLKTGTFFSQSANGRGVTRFDTPDISFYTCSCPRCSGKIEDYDMKNQ